MLVIVNLLIFPHIKLLYLAVFSLPFICPQYSHVYYQQSNFSYCTPVSGLFYTTIPGFLNTLASIFWWKCMLHYYDIHCIQIVSWEQILRSWDAIIGAYIGLFQKLMAHPLKKTWDSQILFFFFQEKKVQIPKEDKKFKREFPFV